jgi:hypothetical protein
LEEGALMPTDPKGPPGWRVTSPAAPIGPPGWAPAVQARSQTPSGWRVTVPAQAPVAIPDPATQFPEVAFEEIDGIPLVGPEFELSAEETYERDELRRDEAVRSLLEIAGTKDASKWAKIQSIHDETGAAHSVIESRLPEFEASAEAGRRDVRTWRRDNPGLYAWVEDDPRRATMLADEHISGVGLWLRQSGAIQDAFDELNKGNPLVKTEGEIKRINAMFDAAVRAGKRQPVGAEPSPLAGLEGIDRPLEILPDFWARRRKESTLNRTWSLQAKLDREVRAARKSGDARRLARAQEAAYRGEVELARLAKEIGPQQEYNQGDLEQLGLDAVEAVSSQVDSLEAMARGASVVGLGGAIVYGSAGFILGKGSKKAAWHGAMHGLKQGASLGSRLFVAGSSFDLERGQAYRELRGMRDDQGKLIDPEIADMAAIVYGTLAATIEVAGLGPEMNLMFGPLANGISSGAGVKALKKAGKAAWFRGVMKRLAKDWAKTAAIEGAEEGSQEFVQFLTEWGAKNLSGASIQEIEGPGLPTYSLVGTSRFDTGSALSRSFEAGRKGMIGSLPMAAGGTVTNAAINPILRKVQDRRVRLAREARRNSDSLRGGAQIAAALGLSQSETARRAPIHAAELFRLETERTGQEVTSFWVDPDPLLAAFREQPDAQAAATEVLGQEAVRRLRQAKAERQEGRSATLEVPVEEFLEKWGEQPYIETLMQHVTVNPEHYTMAQMQSSTTASAKLRDRLIKEEDTRDEDAVVEDPVEVSPEESEFIDVMEKQLVETGKLTKKEARRQIAIPRAIIRTMADRMGEAAKDQFQYWTMTVRSRQQAKEHRAAAVEAGAKVTTAPTMPKFRSLEDAYQDVMGARASAIDSATSPSEQADYRFIRGDDPGPFPGGTFDPVNKHLELTGEDKVRGLRHAWQLLTREGKKDRVRDWDGLTEALNVLREVEGLEDLEAPQEVIEAQLSRDQAEEAAAREADYWADRQRAAEEFDIDVVEELEQPAFHGTPFRGIEKFSLQKVGTGEGAQVYGHGIYFTETPSIAETYRKNLSERGVEGKVSDEKLLSSVIEKLRTASKEMLTEGDRVLGLSDKERKAERIEGKWIGTNLRARALNAKRQADFLDKPGRGSLEPWYAMDILREYGEAGGHQYATHEDILNVPDGQVYKAEIPEDAELLDYDISLFAQPPLVLQKLDAAGITNNAAEYVKRSRDIDDAQLKEKGKRSEEAVKKAFEMRDELGLSDDDIKKLHTWDGNDLYIDLANQEEAAGSTKDARRLASERLRKAGIPGLRYLDGFSRQEGAGTYNFVIWDEGTIREIETLHQGEEADARGRIEIARKGMATAFNVFLDEHADLSTFMHESAHAYFEMMGDLAERGDATDRIREDYQTILDWVGAKDRASLTTEQKEQYARGFEAYLMEGKAPSTRLAEAFAAFRLWMRRIYAHVRNLDVELTEGVRGVFDRMLATDREIEIAVAAAGLTEPMAKSAEEAQMTPAQWDSYLDARARSTLRMVEGIQRQLAAGKLRAAKAFKSDEFAKAKKDATDEWAARRDVRAWRYLRVGESVLADGTVTKNTSQGKLDRELTDQIAGPDSSVVKKLRGRLTREAGLNPHTAAQDLGYEGASPAVAMFAEIDALPKEKDWVRNRAEELMLERNPNIEGELADLQGIAQGRIHTDEISKDVWLKEYSSFGFGPGVIADAGARDAASAIVSDRKLRQLNKGATLNRERSAANKTALAVEKKDFRAAADLKLKQRLEHHKYREIDRAIDDRGKFDKLIKKFTNTQTRKEILGKAGEEFTAIADQILEAIGRSKVADLEVVRERPAIDTSLLSLGIRRGEVLGEPLAMDHEAVVEIVRNHRGDWLELTVGQMRVLKDALDELYTLARDENSMIVEDSRIKLDESVNLMIDQMSVGRKDRGPTPANEEPGFLRGYIANLLEPMELLRDMGPEAYRVMWTDGYLRAERLADKMHAEIATFFGKQWDKLPEEMQRARYDLMDDLEGVTISDDIDFQPRRDRLGMYMVALNMGNKSNRDRLLGGYGWDAKEVLDWLNRNMSKQEWDFVQSVWNLMNEKLYPEMAKTHKEAKGVDPPKVHPMPIVTQYGVFAGGYFPARYNRMNSKVGAMQEQGINGYHQKAGAISVGRSFTKARAQDFSDVIDLNWSIVPGHVMAVIHYTAFDRFVRQANKVLKHPKFKSAVTRRFGKEHYDNLEDENGGWLSAVANAGASMVPRHLGAVYQGLGLTRQAFMFSTIGLSVPIAAADFANPIQAAFNGRFKGRKNKEQLAKSMSKAYGGLAAGAATFGYATPGWGKMRARAEEKSAEILHRFNNTSRHLRELMDLVGPNGAKWRNKTLQMSQDAAFFMLHKTDIMASTIIWDAAYENQLREGKNEAEAVAEADDILQGSMPVIDRTRMASLLRDRNRLSMLLVFQGYFNKNYNQMHAQLDPVLRQWRDAKGKDEKLRAGKEVAYAMGSIWAMFAVSGLLAELFAGHGPEENEDLWQWGLRKMVAAPMLAFPVFGTLGEVAANSLITGKVEHLNMRAGATPSLIHKVSKVAWGAVTVGRDPDRRFWDFVQTVGVLGSPFGLGLLATPQVRKVGEYVWSGEDRSIPGMISGALFGERQAKPLNPVTTIKAVAEGRRR